MEWSQTSPSLKDWTRFLLPVYVIELNTNMVHSQYDSPFSQPHLQNRLILFILHSKEDMCRSNAASGKGMSGIPPAPLNYGIVQMFRWNHSSNLCAVFNFWQLVSDVPISMTNGSTVIMKRCNSKSLESNVVKMTEEMIVPWLQLCSPYTHVRSRLNLLVWLVQLTSKYSTDEANWTEVISLPQSSDFDPIPQMLFNLASRGIPYWLFTNDVTTLLKEGREIQWVLIGKSWI